MSRNHIGTRANIPQINSMPLSARTFRAAFVRYITQVTWVEVTNGGAGYATAPTVVFTGGGGAGAAAVALMRGNAVAAIRVDDPGAGYTSAPTISFTGGGGASAAAIAYLVDPIADMARLKITDCVWHYITNSVWAASVTAAGIRLQGTLSGILPRTTPDACSTSFDGKEVPVGWLPGLGNSFGATQRPGYLTYQASKFAEISGTGVQSIHFDDFAGELSSLRSVGGEPTGGPFDAATIAGFNPNYVAVLQAAGVVQRPYNWTTQAYEASPLGNWSARYDSAVPSEFPDKDAYIAYLKQGVIAYHKKLRANVLGNRTYTVNAYDPLPKGNSYAWALPSGDGALFETDTETYSSAVPATYGQRFSRLWANVKSCEGAGVMCIPHLQPLRNDTINVATRAERVALLKRQTALSFALGARPTYPYDIYLYPFDDTPGSVKQNERFFAKASEGFDSFYAFVANYPQLFDGMTNFNALLLACDVSTDSGRDVNAQICAWADECLRNCIPATFYLQGYNFTRDLALESKATRVVNCSPGFAPTDAITGPNVVSISAYPYTSWKTLGSAATLTGTFTDVFAIPRVGPNSQVFHIVNFDSLVRSNLVLTINAWALKSYGTTAIMWYEPGQVPRQLFARPTALGLEVRLPAVTEWGVLVLSQK